MKKPTILFLVQLKDRHVDDSFHLYRTCEEAVAKGASIRENWYMSRYEWAQEELAYESEWYEFWRTDVDDGPQVIIQAIRLFPQRRRVSSRKREA